MASSALFLHLIPFLLLLLMFNPPSTTAQTYRNVTLGSTLSPLNGSWLSPSGDFAFGFQPLETDDTLFLLAIWFAKTANKTVVWYANGDNPVPAGSSVGLTSSGRLSLNDPTGREIWNASVSTASYAAMLDTGNFVLARSDSTLLWQSFDSPTDTILPSQALKSQSQLRSRLMDTDYSDGRFQLAVQSSGDVEMYLVNVLSGNQYTSYWASNTAGDGSQLVFSDSGSIYIAVENGTNVNFTSGSMKSMRDFYQRGTLDPDGVFRHYVYPKSGSGDEGWTVVALVPSDICQAITTDKGGSGACGFNSYCLTGGSGNQTTDCECPPQYSFIDPSRKYKGCMPDFDAQSCDANGSALFEFKEMLNVDWPLSDYEMYSSIDEDRCKSECLSDCFCAVTIYNQGSCWKKKLPLSNGKSGIYVQRVALIKVPKGNNSQLQLPIASKEKKVSSVWIIAGSSLLGTSVLINFLLLVTICPYKRRTRKLQPESGGVGESLRSGGSGQSLRCFTYKELEEVTNGFSEEIGSGSFGRVYKGYLQTEPRVCVAIKRLDKLLEDSEKEFTNEIKSIGQTHHKNLVRLLGFCNEGTERILVYEYMSNGSLASFLFGGARPDWNLRVQIAMGIARGLLYLHEECTTQIIHCDIKLQNILLDDRFVARISDFGLAKLLRADQMTNTGIRGTRGYVAPEWFKSTAITTKVDVYSFGVILLEMICCRKNVDQEIGSEDEAILTFWAYDCYRDGSVELLVEGDEEAQADLRRVERLVALAIWCIQEEPLLRPTMQKVTQMLDGAAAIPSPPDPSSYMSPIQSVSSAVFAA